MDKVFNIALNDLRIQLSQRGIWLNLVVIPVILIIIIGFVNGGFAQGGSATLRVDTYDDDNSDLSTRFLETLREVNDNVVLCPMDNTDDDICQLGGVELDREQSRQRVQNNVVYAMLEIPAGFSDDVLSGEPVEVVYRSETDLTQTDFLLQSVQTAVQRVAGASVAARVAVDVYQDNYEFNDEADQEQYRQNVYDRATNLWADPPASVDYGLSGENVSDDGDTSGFAQSVPGMGSMYVMFTVLAGAVILIQERKNWTLQRMFTMPLSRAQILGGKMLARFLMGMIQYAVAFAVGFLLGVDFGNAPLALLLVMIAFAACITSIAFLVATFIENEQQASGFTTFLTLTLAPLGGAWWPLEIVPDFMQTIALISPVGWAMDAFNTLIFRAGTFGDVALNIVVLFVATAVLFVIGVFNFRYEG